MTVNFEGHQPRECGEHRTVGPHRAWCFHCSEWCYPASPCARCELPMLRQLTPEFVAGWQAAAAAVERAMQDQDGCLRADFPLHLAADLDQALTEGLLDLGWRPPDPGS